MKKWFNFVIQLLGFGSAVAVPTFVHNEASLATAGGIIAATQGIVAVIAHYYNPDGTSARAPYKP